MYLSASPLLPSFTHYHGIQSIQPLSDTSSRPCNTLLSEVSGSIACGAVNIEEHKEIPGRPLDSEPVIQVVSEGHMRPRQSP